MKKSEEWHDFMVDMVVMRRSMRNMAALWEKLSDKEQQELCDKYPFSNSFDELLADYEEWVEEHVYKDNN